MHTKKAMMGFFAGLFCGSDELLHRIYLSLSSILD
jgi:hypothetical protein